MRLVSRRYNWLRNSRLTSLRLASESRRDRSSIEGQQMRPNNECDSSAATCLRRLVHLAPPNSRHQDEQLAAMLPTPTDESARNQYESVDGLRKQKINQHPQSAQSAQADEALNYNKNHKSTRRMSSIKCLGNRAGRQSIRATLIVFAALLALASTENRPTVAVAADHSNHRLATGLADRMEVAAAGGGGASGKQRLELNESDWQPPMNGQQDSQFRKRANSALEQVSSAELPSEFRDDSDGQQPKEQSTLARLCQQTSSVLASVLPAPFGGHKRSILCQFFGQLHVPAGAANNNKKQPSPIRPNGYQPNGHLSAMQQPLGAGANVNGEPESIAILQQHQQPPIALLATGRHPIQLVLEQQHRQQQQQQQQQQQLRQVAFGGVPLIQEPPQLVSLHSLRPQDPNAAASIINPTFHAYNRLESAKAGSSAQPTQQPPSGQPKQPPKFSSPLATSVEPPPSPSSSTGWRIYNISAATTAGLSSSSPEPASTLQLVLVGDSANASAGHDAELTTIDTFEVVRDSPPSKSTTAAYELKISERQQPANRQVSSSPGEPSKHRNDTTTTARPQPSYQRPKTVVVAAGQQQQQHQSSKQPPPSSTTTIGKRTSETAKPTTKAMEEQISDINDNNNNNNRKKPADQWNETSIRTIEVNAQTGAELMSSASSNSASVVKAGQPAKLQIINLSQQQQPQSGQNKSTSGAELNKQVQKREELVIASINNLTRIAFGNQLRDTVKVINKLIDQQADIFATSASDQHSIQAKKMSATAAASEGNSDPMLTSDSIRSHQMVGLNAINPKDKKQLANKANSSNKKSKLSSSSSNKTTPPKATSSSHKPTTRRPTSTTTGQLSELTLTRHSKARQSAGDGSIPAARNATNNTQRRPTQPSSPEPKKKKQQHQAVNGDNKEPPSTFGRIVAPYKPTRITSSSSSSSSSSGRGAGRKFELAALNSHELRRLSTATTGRSPPASSSINVNRESRSSTTTPMSYRSKAGNDLQIASTIHDISRDHKQGRLITPTTTTRAMQLTPARQPVVGAGQSARWQSQPGEKRPAASVVAVGPYPWLLPEKSALNSDLFAAASGSAEDGRSFSPPAVDIDLGPKRWTTSSTTTTTTIRRKGTSQPDVVRSSPVTIKHSPAGSNRIESSPKMAKADSLTTLKMSLMSSTTAQTSAPPQHSTTARLPFSTGTQSRWIPSTMFATRPASKLTTTSPSSTTSTTTTMIPSPTSPTSTASTSPAPATTLAAGSPAVQHQTSTSSEPITSVSSETLSEFNEARASDSISKYTTHLSESNELLATTSRRHLYGQPLPQIAQTGEYFSAETIASWPERYQTMMSRALEEQLATSSTKAMETTRRNGEAFEFASSPSPTSTSTFNQAARHRLDASSQPSETTLATSRHQPQSITTTTTTTTLGLLNNGTSLGPGVTLLPANHRLISSGQPLPSTTAIVEENEDDIGTDEMDNENDPETTNSMLAATTLMIQQATEMPPTTFKDFTGFPRTIPSTTTTNRQSHEQQQAQMTSFTIESSNQLPDTTIMMDQMASSSSAPSRSFPRVLGDLLLTQNSNNNINMNDEDASANNNNTGGFSLRPPYHRELADDPTLVLDTTQARPQVSKKLYNFLIPSSLRALNQSTNSNNGQFVGQPHNHTTQQAPHRFNLSALKYLAQSLISPRVVANDSSQQLHYPLLDANSSNPDAATMPQRLLELLSGASPSSSSSSSSAFNYYDLLLNDTISPTPSPTTAMTTPGASNESVGAMDMKDNSTARQQTIFGRAGNLLNDLKQLEHRRAAALLAAIRYQVPGPLVKPWDVNSDLLNQQPQSILDRIDSYLASNGSQPQANLLVSQLGRAIKSARLFKQRLVPRHELEARLKGSSRQLNVESSLADGSQQDLDNHRRRSDRVDGDEQELEGNATTSLDQLRYILTNEGGDTLAEDHNDPGQLRAGLVEKLLLSSDGGGARQNNTKDQDFESIDLSSNNKNNIESQTNYTSFSSNQGRPTPIAENSRARKRNQTSIGESLGRQQVAPSEVAARLRLAVAARSSDKTRDKSSIRQPIGGSRQRLEDVDNHQHQNAGQTINEHPKSTFDCNGRASGLYPDVESACRTFYHCSNTGHLLTFDCPSQTRFDEKSLKCGPWFEVPCDLGRATKAKSIPSY